MVIATSGGAIVWGRHPRWAAPAEGRSRGGALTDGPRGPAPSTPKLASDKRTAGAPSEVLLASVHLTSGSFDASFLEGLRADVADAVHVAPDGHDG